ncbi:MAG: asparaginase [Snodgrassella sp.]|nr:asparaginase [Snodgrassella sp.]
MSKRKHLAIYYTGGTIGMKPTAIGLSPAQDLSELTAPIMQEFAEHFSYDWIIDQPLIDSSAITLTDWIKWLQWLDNHAANYHGILILHGTDTMAYTANILALARPQLNKPLILTGAQHPLAAENSDGSLNLRTALAAFTLPQLQSTVIAFNGQLWPAIGSSKVSTESTAGFANAHFGSLAQWSATHGWSNTRFKTPVPVTDNTAVYQLNPAVRIHCFTITPGANTDMISSSLIHNPPDGVILQSYGNGNTPDDAHLLQAIQTIGQNHIPIVNISQVPQGKCASIYAQGHALRQAGVINAGKCNLETALALLTLAVSNHWTTEQILTCLQQHDLI